MLVQAGEEVGYREADPNGEGQHQSFSYSPVSLSQALIETFSIGWVKRVGMLEKNVL